MKKIILLFLCAVFVISLSACKKTETQGAGRADVLSDKIVGDDSDTDDVQTLPEPEHITGRVSVAAVGDNIIYQAGLTDAKNRSDNGGYNFLPNYDNIREKIEGADVAFINQETLVAGEEYGYSDYPRFNSPQSLVSDLIEVGFDVIGMANNHMLDMGTNGLGDTIAYYKTRSDEVTMIGGYENEEDFMTPRVVEVNGIKIAFVAFTYATNGLKLASGSDIYVPYIDDADIERSVAAAKEVADCVILSMHWGEENNFDPIEDQRHAAQVAADCGVLAIIGQHPHVIQPIEWIEGKNGNKMLCIYSLGDLIAVMMKASNMLGGLVTFDIVRDNDDFWIENTVFNPTVFHFGPSYYNGKLYYLSDFTDSLASTFGNVYGITADREDLERIVKKTIDAEFLPDYLKEDGSAGVEE